MGCSIRVVTVLLGYLDLLIVTNWGPIFGIWGPPKSWGPIGGCLLYLPLRPALHYSVVHMILVRLPKNCRNLAVGYLVIWLPYVLCCGAKCCYSGVHPILVKLP